MKNPSYQRRLHAMRQYHANKRGDQFDAGVRAFHRYEEFAEGLDLSVRPVFSRCTLDWCTGLELCIPVEVRNLGELKVLAEIGRRLLKNETTLEALFPGYAYERKEWLAERPQRDALGRFSAQVLSLPVAG